MATDNQTQARVSKGIDDARAELRKMAKQIHEHPEPGMEEKFAQEYLTKFLEEKGFQIEKGVADMATAFVATYDTGRPGPKIGICSEFDALPLSKKVVKHACGHNLIATVGVATALGLKTAISDSEYKDGGRVVLFGTPAEEGHGGKNYMLAKGVFKAADICMMAHPNAGDKDFSRGPMIARSSVKVEYFGKAAHAGMNPWSGINALDAIVLAYNGISTLRQQMIPTDRVHGIITHGGSAPNVIPDHTAGSFSCRSVNKDGLEKLGAHVDKIFRSAADATGCKVELSWDDSPYLDVKNNTVLMDLYAKAMAESGYSDRNPGVKNPDPLTSSTDFGSVSYQMPAIHPMFGIHTEHTPHTVDFVDAADQDVAFDNALVTAKSLAAAGLTVLEDEEVYSNIVKEFQQIKK
ncbi:hypothetical protein NQZ79_g4185 [Umbelopsis isabellina]|nr:hypothetical protein NQZ79_g4185 [Umbelopsis isabellina]